LIFNIFGIENYKFLGVRPMKRYLLLMVFVAMLVEITNAQQWQKVNGPYGGTVVSLYVNRTNGNIFAGTDGNELYRSTDNGNTWNMINSGGPFMQHPNDYALNSSGKMFVACDNGVFVTADNGNSFTKITGDATNQFVTGIVVNSHDKIICCKDPTGIFISTDNGNTWLESNNGLDEKSVSSLIITPNQSVFVGTAKGIYRSDDDGATWTVKNNGLSTIVVNCLAVNSAGVVFTGTTNGFFKSIDNGETWTLSTQGMVGTSIRSISISPSQNLYACDSEGYVYYSNNNGGNWTRIDKRDTPPLYYNSYIFCSAIIADNQLLVGRYLLGIQKTADNGDNWSWSNTSLNGAAIDAFTVNTNGYIFASVRYQGIFVSTDRGNTWNISENGYSSFNSGLKEFKSIIHSSNGVLYAGSNGMGIYVSGDNGASWIERNNGLTDLHIRGLAIHPNGNLFAATASGGIFASTDNGYTWTYSYDSALNQKMLTILIKQDGTIFASTQGPGPGLYRSTNSGITWTLSSSAEDLTNSYSLTENSSGHVFAGSLYGGMYVSTDNGSTWTKSSTNGCKAAVIFSNGNIISAWDNIYKSTDNGATWSDLGKIRDYLVTNCLAVVNPSNDVLMGTEKNGIYKTTSNISACENYTQIPNSYTFMQNYPNPFNPTTTIKYEVKQSGYITIRVFDSIGREIALLVNEDKSPGTYQVNFNAINLPSGVYFYRLTSGAYSETKKLVLLK
jgi:photosystem II stability/assembly factor-like uncharacterized protein